VKVQQVVGQLVKYCSYDILVEDKLIVARGPQTVYGFSCNVD